MSKRVVLVLFAVAAAIAAFLGYDALVVTDEERLEAFVEDTTGPVTAARIEAAQGRWVDLSREPFEVGFLGASSLYREGEEATLAERARRALSPMMGSDLTSLTSGITVEGDEARVTVRVLGEGRGMGRLVWTLRRHGDDWLVSSLRVSR